jgi:ADP-ribose pyrophosphatase YjhB (NUDIX family)
MNRPRSTDRSLFRYCPFCGTAMKRTREGGFQRAACPSCRYVQYRNPVVGVAAVITEADVLESLGEDAILEATGEAPAPATLRVLLGRRALTYKGTYCFPCGYVEFDEEIREAIRRETREETGLVIDPVEVFAAHSNFHDADRQSVGIWFRARVTGGELRAGDDLDALKFVTVADPGVPLAFPTDALVFEQLAREAHA